MTIKRSKVKTSQALPGNSGVTAGSYTNSDLTIAADGTVTAAANGSSSSGTVTTTGSPTNGNLAKFTGATSVSNADLTGDVTTSGTVATTLANTAVTPASYTNTNLTVDSKGRITAASNGSSGSPGGSDKDIQYNNSSAFGGITPGVAGTVLTSNGVTSTASFQAAGGSSGALVLLEQHTASATATLDFTAFISATYDNYVFELLSIVPVTNNVSLIVRVGTGAGPTWDSSADYGWAYIASNSNAGSAAFGGALAATQIELEANISNAATDGVSGTFKQFSPASTRPYFTYQMIQRNITPLLNQVTGAAQFNLTTALTGVRFLFTSGSIATGTIRVYGIAK